MAQKPSIPKGTKDLLPSEIARRDYILDKIRNQFELFGFLPIETPSLENLSTLLGKYGEEGDRLIFKILNSGDYLSKIDPATLATLDSKKITPLISQKALRYDLTVPFARYVVMHRNEIDLPFKRYQIQPVWRADRPQKGRFREFYQCDADVVGSDSLLQEIELILLYDSVFTELGFPPVRLKFNHRKLLSGIAKVIGAGDHIVDFTTALDKLDKIGKEGVLFEMRKRGISDETLKNAAPLFELQGSVGSVINQLRDLIGDDQEGVEGLEAVQYILDKVSELGLNTCEVHLDITLARGLNYYTGSIFEVEAPTGISMGSIGGGGRYDDLTGIFGMSGISGIGISFGLERIYLVMQELNLFPDTVARPLDVLCLNFGEKEALEAMKLVQEFRKAGLKSDLYPSSAKIQKQMKYANSRNASYVVLIGDQELAAGEFVVKDMVKGVQQSYKLSEVPQFVQSL